MRQWLFNLCSEFSYLRKNRAFVELIYSLTAIFAFIILSFSLDTELFETLYQFSRSHEHWELDEILISFIWVALIASIYAYRRVKDLIYLNKDNEYNANHDALTGLPNRYFAQRLMAQMLARAERYQRSVVVIFIDLNKFKYVNDSFGHDHGDLLLQQAGQRLLATVRNNEIVARLGGDEFLVVAELSNDLQGLSALVARIQGCTTEAFTIFDKQLDLSFSIGVALYPEHGETINDLLAAADSAMYEAKRNPDGLACEYNHEIGERNLEYARLSTKLKNALAQHELQLVFQPIINTDTDQIEGYEALTRWYLNGDNIDPVKVISIAESIGLSEAFFRWLIESALSESADFLTAKQFVSINVTAKQFLSEHFLGIVGSALEKHPNRHLSLEITETAIAVDYQSIVSRIRQLRAWGVSVMIDDFGSGYSILAKLSELEVDTLKIDRSFLQEIGSQSKGAEVFQCILMLAEKLEMKVVAEGIETPEQLAFLRQHAPVLAQGYLIQKPSEKSQMQARIDLPKATQTKD